MPQKREIKTDYSKVFRNFFFFLGICFFSYLILRFLISPTQNKNPITEQLVLKRTLDNYQSQVDSISKSFNVNPNFLFALIVLECSGKKNFKPRFEKHIYDQLKNARDRNINFGSISRKTIHDASDAALKNLATSWGPFQLMGYQCIELEVNVADIRGDHAIYWGVYWMKKRYGKYLDTKDYANAFHIHNTGKPIPSYGKHTTYDPNYVSRGLDYMNFFAKKQLN